MNPQLDLLHVKRDQIVDTQGNPVRLRGVCIGGWMNTENFINGYPGAEQTLRRNLREVLGASKGQFFFDRMLDYFFTEADVALIKQCGATVVRLPFNYRHFEKDDAPFRYVESGFNRLNQALAWCAKYGLYAILDLHAVQGWQNSHWHSDNANAIALLWSQPHYQDRFVALWEEFARRYKDNPVVAGYDLMNEPLTGLPNGHHGRAIGFDWDGLNAIYHRTIKAIRAIDPAHIIFLEGDVLGRRFHGLDVFEEGNVVMTSHNYNAGGTGLGIYPGVINGIQWDKPQQKRAFLEHEGTLYTQKHHVPLWAGEFGAMYNRPPEEAHSHITALDDQISVMEEYGAHWTTWTYKDVGAMGWVYLDPQSEYMQRIKPILQVKREFHMDYANYWLPSSPARNLVMGLAGQMEETLGDPTIDSEQLGMVIRHGALEFGFGLVLQTNYAKQFIGLSETELDRILQSFELKNCVRQDCLLQIVEKHLRRPA